MHGLNVRRLRLKEWAGTRDTLFKSRTNFFLTVVASLRLLWNILRNKRTLPLRIWYKRTQQRCQRLWMVSHCLFVMCIQLQFCANAKCHLQPPSAKCSAFCFAWHKFASFLAHVTYHCGAQVHLRSAVFDRSNEFKRSWGGKWAHFFRRGWQQYWTSLHGW